MTFKDCLAQGIEPYSELIVKISDTASKEYSIEHILDKMVGEWDNNYLELTAYKKTGKKIAFTVSQNKRNFFIGTYFDDEIF